MVVLPCEQSLAPGKLKDGGLRNKAELAHDHADIAKTSWGGRNLIGVSAPRLRLLSSVHAQQ